MARSFTKIVAFAFALTFVFGIARTSQAQDANNDPKPLTAQGSAAFMFTIQGLAPFSIGAPGIGSVHMPMASTFDGTTTLRDSSVYLSGVGVKYFLSDNMALRIALAFLSNSSGADSLQSGAESITAFGIGAGLEWHMRPLYSTSPYIGGQVSFASSSADNKTGTGGKDNESKASSSNFGIAAIAGFDWFFTKGIAIGAEASLGFNSESSSSTYTPSGGSSTTTTNPSSTTIALATGASAHVVVYF